ncbi:MAG TPA: methyltransferase [Candidatus Acidoferrales bacterium]|nr:methyltransferase [Candidatus Acidoferrales bacterium]
MKKNFRTTKPSSQKITDSVYAFREARVLLTAYELGLFTIIGDEPRPSEEIARLAGTNPRATDRLLNALCASGYLQKKAGSFSNTPLSSRFLVRGKPNYLGGLMHQVHLWNTWSQLTGVIRRGTRAAGREPASGAEWLEAFIAAMHMRAKHQASPIVKLIDLKGVSHVLDVGGGSGAFSFAFVRAKRELTATVFDLPGVVPLTRGYIEMEDLGDLVSVVAGDYTVDALGKNFDLVFMSAIIHSNSARTNRELFHKAFEALNAGGRLVVSDYMMNNDRTSPAAGAYFSLNMLVGTTEGDTYTESEVRGWMEEAGFRKVRRTNTNMGADLMIGTKPS